MSEERRLGVVLVEQIARHGGGDDVDVVGGSLAAWSPPLAEQITRRRREDVRARMARGEDAIFDDVVFEYAVLTRLAERRRRRP